MRRGEKVTPGQIVAYISNKAKRSECVYIPGGVEAELPRLHLTIRHMFDALRKDPRPHGPLSVDKYGDCHITVSNKLHGPGDILINAVIVENGAIWIKAVS